MRTSKCLWLGMLAVSSCSLAQQALTPLPPGPKAYTMVLTSTEVKTLQDGSTITHITVQRTFHDSQGRQRTEQDEQRGATFTSQERGVSYLQPTAKTTRISITDATHRSSLYWTVGPNQARMVRQSRADQAPHVETTPRQAPSADAPKAEQRREPLGRKAIMGLEADGSRLTTNYPANFDGNSMPYTETAENWAAHMGDGYQTVEFLTEGPGTKSSTVLTSFTEGEPDPKLFEPPADYPVLDPSKPAGGQAQQ